MEADSVSRSPSPRLSESPVHAGEPATSPAAARLPVQRDKPRGLAGAFRDEAAFRQELALAVVVIPLGLKLGHTAVERAVLIAPVLFVLVVELLNSAIEATVDRIGFERHELAGLAKDIGSAAVFMSFVLLGAVWLIVLLGR